MRHHSVFPLLVFVFALIPIIAVMQIRDWPDDEREGIKINYTEANVPAYTLPELLTLQDGEKVTDTKTWNEKRRPEILKLLVENQFGRAPGNPEDVVFTVFDEGTPVFEGKALRRQITLHFGRKGPEADLLVYLPANAEKPSPLLLNISFMANCQTVNDSGVKEGMTWNMEKQRVPAGRESMFPKIDVMQFIERGYGFATVNYGDFEPDFREGLEYGIRRQYLKPGQTVPGPDEWGAVAAWAWGLSRVMDYFETDPEIDEGRVAITGVSRLGKTALWTAAADPRFAMAIPSCSGQGGAALSRRNYGETIKLITLPQRYGYQFCANYAKWGDDPNAAPMDAHML
ncbi:MAG: acetylxylan esterase, partial [Acidobacteria bacterium]|nr:acetylxylan esterase [Acidobacteriota bacterium]